LTPLKFNQLVKRMLPRLKRIMKKHNANAIAVSGHSGTVLGGALAFKMGVPIFAVRKSMDTQNDSYMADGFWVQGECRYVIIDDLISSGTTVERILREIHKQCKKEREGWEKYSMGNPTYTAMLEKQKMIEPVAVLLYCNQGEKKTRKFNRAENAYRPDHIELPVYHLDTGRK
jgi:hypoxanthine phosphoribosyltransferase